MKRVFLALQVLFSFLFVMSCTNKESNNNSISQTNNESVDSAMAIQLKIDSVRFDELVLNFDYREDNYNNAYYRHKSKKNYLTETGLTSIVWSDGFTHLTDRYLGTENLSHTKIRVQVGEKIYVSNEVSLKNSLNFQTHYDGENLEVIDYFNGDDRGIYMAIVESKEDDIIKVCFTGGKLEKEIVLSKTDIIALKESNELSEILKRRDKIKEE